MLYLAKPKQNLSWNDLPWSLLDVNFPGGEDPTTLDWTPAESQPDEVVVGLALRHGRATSDGIIVDGSLLALRKRPEELGEQLGAPVNPDLRKHWQDLGGEVPTT